MKRQTHDGVVAVGEQALDLGGEQGELLVELGALEGLGLPG